MNSFILTKSDSRIAQKDYDAEEDVEQENIYVSQLALSNATGYPLI